MTRDQEAILSRFGVSDPSALEPIERLRWANAGTEADVLSRSSVEAVSYAHNIDADDGAFALDGDKLIASGFLPVQRLEITRRFDAVAGERKRRSLGQTPLLPNDTYSAELLSIQQFATDYTGLVIARMLGTKHS